MTRPYRQQTFRIRAAVPYLQGDKRQPSRPNKSIAGLHPPAALRGPACLRSRPASHGGSASIVYDSTPLFLNLCILNLGWAPWHLSFLAFCMSFLGRVAHFGVLRADSFVLTLLLSPLSLPFSPYSAQQPTSWGGQRRFCTSSTAMAMPGGGKVMPGR